MDSGGGEGGGDEQPPHLSPLTPPPPPPPPPPPLSPGGGGGGGNMNMNKESPPLLPSKAETPNFIGKHRMAAAVAHLHHQIQIIQEELDELETFGESSLVCKELVSAVESVPDALLSVTKGPADVGWDRWFQGAHGSRTRKRWI